MSHATGHPFRLRGRFCALPLTARNLSLSPTPPFATRVPVRGQRPLSAQIPRKTRSGAPPHTPPPLPADRQVGGAALGPGAARRRRGRAGAAPPGRSAKAGGRGAWSRRRGAARSGAVAERWHAVRRHAALPARCPADMDRRRLPPPPLLLLLLLLLLCAALGAAGRLSARPGNEGEPRPGRVPPGTRGWGTR